MPFFVIFDVKRADLHTFRESKSVQSAHGLVIESQNTTEPFTC